MKTFRQWVAEFLPTSLRDEVGERFAMALALVPDSITEILIEAVFARALYSAEFPADALRLVGSERMMPRYRNESDAQYLGRLRGAWVAWEYAGTRQAIESQLAAAGYTAYVRENHQWDWDGDSANWPRFWVVITGHPWERWHYGDGHVWGQTGLTWGSTATSSEITTLRQLEQQWKPGHTRCVAIILVFDEGTWDADQPDGTWDDPPSRNLAVTYLPG